MKTPTRLAALALTLAGIGVLMAGCSSGSSMSEEERAAVSQEIYDKAMGASSPKPLTPCDEAANAAASVPLAEPNDAEVVVMLSTCDHYDDFVSAVRARPSIFGVANITASEIDVTLEFLCPDAQSTPVCGSRP